MATPNLANFKTITPFEVPYDLTDTSPTVIANNAASSGTFVHVEEIEVCNEDGSNNTTFLLQTASQDDGGGTLTTRCPTIPIPSNSILLLPGAYLLEDKSLVATAGAGNDLTVTVKGKIYS